MTIGGIQEALAFAGVTDATLTAQERGALDRDGYALLRGAIPPAWCPGLIETFERKYVPSDKWPMPRGYDARHAMLNDESDIRRACLVPRVLAAAHHVLRRRFFLSDVQGRDPLPGGGYQHLHRDCVAPEPPAAMVIALAFLEPFGAANGATRLIPGSHLIAGGANAYRPFGAHHDDQRVVEGAGGDVLVMNGYLAHSGQRNGSGAHRRNLQINFLAFEMHAAYVETRDLRGAPPEVRYLLGLDD